MPRTRTDTELAEAILAAIEEAREHGVSEERIVQMLADVVKGLREALSRQKSRGHVADTMSIEC